MVYILNPRFLLLDSRQIVQKPCECDQKMPQSQTTDRLTAPRGRGSEHLQQHNQSKLIISFFLSVMKDTEYCIVKKEDKTPHKQRE